MARIQGKLYVDVLGAKDVGPHCRSRQRFHILLVGQCMIVLMISLVLVLCRELPDPLDPPSSVVLIG